MELANMLLLFGFATLLVAWHILMVKALVRVGLERRKDADV